MRPNNRMENSIVQSGTLVLLWTTLTLGGCTQLVAERNFDGHPWVRKNAQSLDKMASRLNEYGTVGMSAPLIVEQGQQFQFNIAKSADTLYQEARTEIQGRAAAAAQEVDIMGFGVSAQVDPTQIAKYGELLKNYQDQRIDYLGRRNERDRSLSLAQAARTRASRLELDASLSAAQAEPDLIKRAQAEAAAYKAYATATSEAVPDAPTEPTFPTAPTDGSNVPPKQNNDIKEASTARGVLFGDGKLSGAGSLLGSNPTVVSTNRSALIASAGDTAVKGLLQVLHNPQEALIYQGKKAIFGAAMVSVAPGWRTTENFAARLTVRPELIYEPARLAVAKHVREDLRKRLGNKDGQPLRCGELQSSGPEVTGYEISEQRSSSQKTPAAISAISPMTDTQNLQLSNSLRSRKERTLQLALALRSAGFELGSQFFKEYLQNTEKDMLTSNREMPVAAFSTGNQFGYEIGPEFWGLADPTAKKSRSAYRLVRQSFPALILLGFDDAQLQPVLKCEKATEEPMILEPNLKFTQTRRWVPLNEGAVDLTPSEADLIELNDEITRTFGENPEECERISSPSKGCVNKSIKQQINSRGVVLAEELLGNWNTQALPLCLVIPTHPDCLVADKERVAKSTQKDIEATVPGVTMAPATKTAVPTTGKPSGRK